MLLEKEIYQNYLQKKLQTALLKGHFANHRLKQILNDETSYESVIPVY